MSSHIDQGLRPDLLLFDGHAHAAGGSGHHAHGGFDAAGVQVGHLDGSDLLALLLRQLTHLVLVVVLENFVEDYSFYLNNQQPIELYQ